MTILMHHCPALGGTSRLGDELDCPGCRALLLDAFRGPVEPDFRPGGLPVPLGPAPEFRTPGERVSAGLNNLGRCEYCAHPLHGELWCSDECGCERGYPALWQYIPRQVAGHHVRWTVQDFRWRAVCSCGWLEYGVLPPTAEPADAKLIARNWGEHHLNYPHPGKER